MNAENDRKTLLSNYYKAKEQIINSENDIDKKYDAWKQQASVISQLFKDNINNKIKNDLLERHCKQQKLLFDIGEFMKLRLKNVENLLDIKSAVIENALSPCDTERALPDINNMTIPHAQEEDFDLNLSQLNVWSSSSTVRVNKTFHEKQNTGTKEKFMQREPIKDNSSKKGEFTTARQLLLNQKQITTFCSLASQENQNESKTPQQPFFNYGLSKKSLSVRNKGNVNKIGPKSSKDEDAELNSLMMHPALKTVDIKMVEMITNEIIQKFKAVDWHEIAGLDYAKSVIKEAVVYPLLRPDIFTGLRRPPRGILLFGPPGTGKTLIGKCIASQSKSTFFCISASSLTSKWMGESEKLVRALFAVAEARQPSIIFLDEVDSLLTQRSEAENECTRRLKTEFLVRLDGASTSDNERILIVGATNRPQELDEAVRRRFTKRLYVALPVMEARLVILQNLLQMVNHDISLTELQKIAELTEGYSGADMDSLCRESSMEPLRAIPFEAISTFNENNLRAVNFIDFQNALDKIRPSVSTQDLQQYVNWNKTYGSTV